MPPISLKWIGPVFVAIGMVMLAVQVYAYLDVGLVVGWLVGEGIGLVAMGAISWFYFLDDKRSPTVSSDHGHLPTADEYDRRFEEIEQVGDNENELPHLP